MPLMPSTRIRGRAARGIACRTAGPELPHAEQRSNMTLKAEDPCPRDEHEGLIENGGTLPAVEDTEGTAAIWSPHRQTGNRGNFRKRHGESQAAQWLRYTVEQGDEKLAAETEQEVFSGSTRPSTISTPSERIDERSSSRRIVGSQRRAYPRSDRKADDDRGDGKRRRNRVDRRAVASAMPASSMTELCRP